MAGFESVKHFDPLRYLQYTYLSFLLKCAEYSVPDGEESPVVFIYAVPETRKIRDIKVTVPKGISFLFLLMNLTLYILKFKKNIVLIWWRYSYNKFKNSDSTLLMTPRSQLRHQGVRLC